MEIRKYKKKHNGADDYELWFVKSVRVRKAGRKSYTDKRKVERIGFCSDLEKEDPDYLGKYRALAKEKGAAGGSKITVTYDTGRELPAGSAKLKSLGYAFVEAVYYALGIDKAVNRLVRDERRAKFDSNRILRDLVAATILMPGSKKRVYEQASEHFLEAPDYSQESVYRFLSAARPRMEEIIGAAYLRAQRSGLTDKGVVYYDCTNFFFEIEEEDGPTEGGGRGLRQYGKSKESRPNPIVQLGLFMDANGFPINVVINDGSANEQTTLRPGQDTLKRLGVSEYTICTDAGLNSAANMRSNAASGRGFICTADFKLREKKCRTEAEREERERRLAMFSEDGWRMVGDASGRLYTLSEAKTDGHLDDRFYKERTLNIDDGWKSPSGEANHAANWRRQIVTFSYRYFLYQRSLRSRQAERAKEMIEKGKSPDAKPQNSHKRLVKATHVTESAEVAGKAVYSLDEERIAYEEKWDGFYAVTTNLKDPVEAILKVMSYRQEIEGCFRTMKSDFKGRPVHLSREDRIRAHFMTVTLSLMVLRTIEVLVGAVDAKATKDQILDALRGYWISDEGTCYVGQMTVTQASKAVEAALRMPIGKEAFTTRQIQSLLKKVKETRIKNGKVTKTLQP